MPANSKTLKRYKTWNIIFEFREIYTNVKVAYTNPLMWRYVFNKV